MEPLPGTPEEHMDALLRFLLPAARRMIDSQGGFRPFGASMAPDGELLMLESEGTTEEEELDALRRHASSQASSLLATGICADVSITTGTFPEAIRIELEHRDASPSTWLVPYRSTDHELTFAEPVRLSGERRTWR